MRPVNLIPPEERRGERVATRTGPLVYVVVGVLGAVLVGLALVVTTNNSISDHKSQRKELSAEKVSLAAQSQALRNYTDFAQLEQQRQQTVVSLAHSRFDWERVMRELSLVLPDDVWLIKVSGTVSPEVSVEDDPAIGVRDSIPGPALELVGCGRSQDSVARFVAALHNIDGVTRVTVNKSEKPSDDSDQNNTATASGGASGGASQGDECRTRDTIPKFEIVAAFDDAVPAVPAAPGTPGAPAAPAPTTSSGSTAPTGSSGVSDAQQQQASASQATTTATEQAQNAANIVPGK
jgi:Tfp pilus assembly protein PilN